MAFNWLPEQQKGACQSQQRALVMLGQRALVVVALPLECRDKVGRHRDRVGSLEEARDKADSLEAAGSLLLARGRDREDNPEEAQDKVGNREVVEWLQLVPVAGLAPVAGTRPGFS